MKAMETNAVTVENMNRNMRNIKYEVCPIVARADEIETELKKGEVKPFNTVIRADKEDAHAMGQQQITFIRQVVACVTLPELIEKGGYPEDVKQRARDILGVCGGGSVGSYPDALGIELIRRHVGEYIERRDGHPSDWRNIFLSAGATTALRSCLELLCRDNGKPSGVMIPIPQCPLYSASLAEYGLKQVGYYLDEERAWGLDPAELERSFQESSQRCNVRAIIVINPGNPAGQVLTQENMEAVIKFARTNNLLIFANEMYQDNVYTADRKFYSFKKVLCEMSREFSDQELISFMSISKGYAGEAGLRGGWMELVNIEAAVQAQLYKCIAATLCPMVLGQVALDCVVKPPRPGEPSYELWHKEVGAVLRSLGERADMITYHFNQIKGVECNAVQGAMYAFPRIDLPLAAQLNAHALGMEPDVYYARMLLERTGICVLPGSYYGQKPGTHHIRITILPPLPQVKEMLLIFKDFHEVFTRERS